MKRLAAFFQDLANQSPETRAVLVPLLRSAGKWNKLPKGWTQDSVNKFWNTLTGESKHKVTKCIERMEGKGIDDTGAFCAALADKVIGTDWRYGPRKKKTAGSMRVVFDGMFDFARAYVNNYARFIQDLEVLMEEWAFAVPIFQVLGGGWKQTGLRVTEETEVTVDANDQSDFYDGNPDVVEVPTIVIVQNRFEIPVRLLPKMLALDMRTRISDPKGFMVAMAAQLQEDLFRTMFVKMMKKGLLINLADAGNLDDVLGDTLLGADIADKFGSDARSYSIQATGSDLNVRAKTSSMAIIFDLEVTANLDWTPGGW